MKRSLLFFIIISFIHTCDERLLPLGSATHILTQPDSPNKVEYIKSLLYKPREIEEYSASIQQNILKSCRSNRELWLQYVAGYMQYKNPVSLERRIATTWPVEKNISMQLKEYNHKFKFEDCCVLPCGAVVAGVSKEKKTISLPNHFWWTTSNNKEIVETSFKLIHLSTGIVLLQRAINISGNFKVVCEEKPLRIEIINETCNVCHIVDVASYYEALNNVSQVNLKKYLEFVRYNQTKNCLQENDFVVI